MEKIIVQNYRSPAGDLVLGSLAGELCLCDWRFRKRRDAIDRRIQKFFSTSYKEGDSPLIEAARTELEEYFRGERQVFSLPLRPAGTDFQISVWDALGQIPYGETVSYRDLARKLGRSDAVRAVAAANGANALSLFIPCHRIIGSGGELTGYAGGLEAKELLLDLERGAPHRFPFA